MTLTDRLQELERRVMDVGAPVAALLLPGVDLADSPPGLGVYPGEVVEWFAWHNGVAERPGQLLGEVNLIPGFRLVSISEALEMRSAYSGDDILGDFWVPLLASGGGDIYAAVWSPSSTVAQVATVVLGEPTEVEFDSLSAMVEAFVRCFDQGAFFLAENGFLDMDPEVYSRVRGDGGS